MTAFEKAMRLSPLDPQWGASSQVRDGLRPMLGVGVPKKRCPGSKSTSGTPRLRGIHRLLDRRAMAVRSTRGGERGRPKIRRDVSRFSLRHYRKVIPYRRTPEQLFDALREAGLPE